MATTDPFEKFREDAANDISAVNRELLATTDLSKELDKEFNKINSNLRSTYNSTTSVRDALISTLDLVSKLGREYVDADKITERIVENNTKNLNSQASAKSIYDGILTSYTSQLGSQTQALSLLGTQEQYYQDILSRMESSSATIRATVDNEEKELVVLMQQIESRNIINKLLADAQAKVDGFNKKVQETSVKATALSKIFGSISGIPFLKDFMNFKQLSDAFQKGFGPGMKDLGSQLKSILRSPLFLALALVAALRAIVKLAFDYDKIVTDISNNTGITKNASIDLLDTFRGISAEGSKVVGSLSTAFLSVKNQANAMLELQDTLETNALFTNERIQNEILLTKQMKMSKEEATGIQKLSLITGQSAEKILNTAMKQNNTAISYKKVFAEISKLNSEISTAYKNNPELIAKAVIEANKLGMSLEQTQKISKSLLDFESSISGELESELLLGKQFNFEKARALALDGRSAEAATELMSQIGGINALTQMNVIQRERLAASIGMSAEELTTSAREQAVLNALGVENKNALEERYEILRKNGDLAGIEALKAEAAKKEGGALLIQDIARANLQDRFNASMERVKEIFTELSTSLIPIIENLAKFLSNTTILKIVLASLVGITAMIAANIAMATGGISLLVGGLAALGAGYMISGGAGEASLPTKNTALPTFNQQGGGGTSTGNTSGGSSSQQTTAHFYLDSKQFATAIASSNHTSGT
jgi:hypothetical protein